MSRPANQRGFTLLEVVLAVTLTVSLMGAVMWFYHSAVDTRAAVVREADLAASSRMIMDRLTDELRGATANAFLGIGMEGQTDGLSFLSSRLPGPAVWAERNVTEEPPPAQSDMQLVGYRLSTWTDEDGLLHVAGLERTVQAIPSASQVEDNQAVKALLLTASIKFLCLRYWDGANWLASWSGGDLPSAVEITMGPAPLPEGADPADYPYRTFRRTVFIPAGQAGKGGPTRGEP